MNTYHTSTRWYRDLSNKRSRVCVADSLRAWASCMVNTFGHDHILYSIAAVNRRGLFSGSLHITSEWLRGVEHENVSYHHFGNVITMH